MKTDTEHNRNLCSEDHQIVNDPSALSVRWYACKGRECASLQNPKCCIRNSELHWAALIKWKL